MTYILGYLQRFCTSKAGDSQLFSRFLRLQGGIGRRKSIFAPHSHQQIPREKYLPKIAIFDPSNQRVPIEGACNVRTRMVI
jgi:hypothetical protein